ncbi:unnamed protein product, partial [Mesorhabditis spiculigera]
MYSARQPINSNKAVLCLISQQRLREDQGSRRSGKRLKASGRPLPTLERLEKATEASIRPTFALQDRADALEDLHKKA